MKIKDIDLFTYYLQKNLWAKGVGYDEFVEKMKQQGVEIEDEDEDNDGRHCDNSDNA